MPKRNVILEIIIDTVQEQNRIIQKLFNGIAKLLCKVILERNLIWAFVMTEGLASTEMLKQRRLGITLLPVRDLCMHSLTWEDVILLGKVCSRVIQKH